MKKFSWNQSKYEQELCYPARRALLIMKDEILLVFGEDGKLNEYNSEFDITIHCETKKDMDEAISLIERAERLRWHDVNKEMPEDDTDPYAEDCSVEVYVLMSDGSRCIAYHVKGDPAEEWMLGGECGGFTITGITHWMYQPEEPDKSRKEG